MRAREPDVQGVRRPRRPADRLRDLQRRGSGRTADRRCCSCRSTRACRAGRGRPRSRTSSQHYRVVTIDPRGNGRSDRPTDPAEYGDLDFVADTVAVMDAAGVDRAVLVGHLRERLAGDAGRVAAPRAGPGRGRGRAVALRRHAAAAVPGRGRRALRGRAAVLRGLDDGQPALPRGRAGRSSPPSSSTRCCCEPHSTKQLEDILGCDRAPRRGRSSSRSGTAARYPEDMAETEALLRAIDRPVLVIRGTEDRCQPLGPGSEPRRVDRW